MKRSVIITASLILINAGCASVTSQSTNSPDFFQYLHNEVQSFKKKNGIKGLAVALFDNEKIVWKQSLGRSSYGFRVNDSTMFSLQSVSKNITALAVLLAVEEGLLDLDTPISKYLTDFSIKSCFQENPEEAITLRMLLAHTAGFPHEAPVGNNFDCSFPSIEEHLRSIEDVWLKFPAGSNYSYSNLGFDIAAKIIETVSHETFDRFLHSRIFTPLGMYNSTANDSVFTEKANKTEGIIEHVKVRHYPIPLIGSGAAYSSLNDMVKYVQVHLNLGVLDGNTFINKESLFEMYKIYRNHYGLGTYIDTLFNSYYLNHNGGGFGYGSSILWFPEYNIGCVVLANKPGDCFELASTIINKHINEYNPGRDRDALRTFEFNPFGNMSIQQEIVFSTHCEGDSIFKEEWENYLASYEVVLGGYEYKWYAKLAFTLGKKPFTINLFRIEDEFWVDASWLGKSKLYEYQPGVFFTKNGRALDLRNGNLTFDNLKIIKY